MHFKIQTFTSQNLVYQAAVFCVRNAPKVTYERLKFEKFFRGLYARTIVKKGKEDMRRERRGRGGRGRGGEGRQGEGGKGRRGGKRVVPPRFKLVPPPASLGLATALSKSRAYDPQPANSQVMRVGKTHIAIILLLAPS
jgi:hypothetical protein